MLAHRVAGLREAAAAVRQRTPTCPWLCSSVVGVGRPATTLSALLLGLGMHPQLGRRGIFIFTAAGAGMESAG
jgi:hypothetical protein